MNKAIIVIILTTCAITSYADIRGKLRIPEPSLFMTSDISQSQPRAFPPNLSYKVSIETVNSHGVIRADSITPITISIANMGKGIAYNVGASINYDTQIQGIVPPSTLNFGNIPEGTTITKTMSIHTTDQLKSGKIKLTAFVSEATGFNPEKQSYIITTEGYKAPQLVVGAYPVDNNLRPGEIKEIDYTITNTGLGDAADVHAKLVVPANVYLGGDLKANHDLGTIKHGESKKVAYIIYSNSNIPDHNEIPISLVVDETKQKYGTTAPLVLYAYHPDMGYVTELKPTWNNKITTVADTDDIDTKIPDAAVPAGKDDVAVIIGNSLYQSVPSDDFAVNDARLIKKYLITTLGYQDSQILYAENATLGQMNLLLGDGTHNGELQNHIKSGRSNVVIYYAGHGAPDINSSEAYFVPTDMNINYLSTTGYALRTFYNNMAKLQAKHVTVILDACFSGQTDNGILFKNISPAMLKVKKEYLVPPTVTLLASSSYDEVSTWYQEKRHSMFTYWFLRGLQGAADGNHDKTITLRELKDYLSENVPYESRKLHGIDQHPVIIGDMNSVFAGLK